MVLCLVRVSVECTDYSEAQSRGSREVSADRRECGVQLQLQLQQLMMYLVKYETVNRPSCEKYVFAWCDRLRLGVL